MGDRGVLLNAVPQVEYVWSAGQRVKDPGDRFLQRLAASDQGERVEIALDRHPVGKLAAGPGRVDRLVESDRIHPGFAGIGAEPSARSLGKADDRHVGMASLQLIDDPGGPGDNKTLE